MAAWSAAIAYAINYIVVYLSMTLAVVVVVGIMGCLASTRIRRSPPFIILSICTALCVCALGLSVHMNKIGVVNPQKHFNPSFYTSVIAITMGKLQRIAPLNDLVLFRASMLIVVRLHSFLFFSHPLLG